VRCGVGQRLCQLGHQGPEQQQAEEQDPGHRGIQTDSIAQATPVDCGVCGVSGLGPEAVGTSLGGDEGVLDGRIVPSTTQGVRSRTKHDVPPGTPRWVRDHATKYSQAQANSKTRASSGESFTYPEGGLPRLGVQTMGTASAW
jgi:hypothetical protein